MKFLIAFMLVAMYLGAALGMYNSIDSLPISLLVLAPLVLLPTLYFYKMGKYIYVAFRLLAAIVLIPAVFFTLTAKEFSWSYFILIIALLFILLGKYILRAYRSSY